MKAVIETGGKQYNVAEGTVLYIEKLDAKDGEKVNFDKVLMANGEVGHPYLNNVVVEGVVVKSGKAKKINSINLSKMYKDNRHLFYDGKKCYTEREILRKRFDFKAKL